MNYGNDFLDLSLPTEPASGKACCHIYIQSVVVRSSGNPLSCVYSYITNERTSPFWDS